MFGLSEILGGSVGGSALNSAAGPASNSSVNITGSTNGLQGLAGILQLTSGNAPTLNGGYYPTGFAMGGGSGIMGRNAMPLIIGGVALVAVVLLMRK